MRREKIKERLERLNAASAVLDFVLSFRSFLDPLIVYSILLLSTLVPPLSSSILFSWGKLLSSLSVSSPSMSCRYQPSILPISWLFLLVPFFAACLFLLFHYALVLCVVSLHVRWLASWPSTQRRKPTDRTTRTQTNRTNKAHREEKTPKENE